MAPRAQRLHLTRYVMRGLVLALRVLIIGMAMGMTPPSLVEAFLRHEDTIAEVSEEKLP